MSSIKPFNPIEYVTHGIESNPSSDALGYFEITGDKKTDIANVNAMLSKQVIMVGEAHDDEYCQWFIEEIIKLFKPDYFLTEHTQYLDVLPGQFQTRLKTLKHDGLPYNRYTEHWLTVGARYKIPFIGMDYLPPDGKLSTFEELVYESPLASSFGPRESRMLECLEKYLAKGRVLLQVGDTHLRSSDDFFDNGRSPLSTFAENHPDTVGVFRLARIFQEML